MTTLNSKALEAAIKFNDGPEHFASVNEQIENTIQTYLQAVAEQVDVRKIIENILWNNLGLATIEKSSSEIITALRNAGVL